MCFKSKMVLWETKMLIDFISMEGNFPISDHVLSQVGNCGAKMAVLEITPQR